MRIKEYKYCARSEEESQYSELACEGSSILDARYIPAMVKMDVGNPYIEALPLPRSDASIKHDYTKTLLSYNYDDVKKMSKLEKMLNVGTLRTIRFPLMFHKNLEFAFYNALVTSYRSRQFLENEETPGETLLCGDSGASTNAGFSLIGYSGCGKSSAINILLSHYPQVIIHETEYGNKIPQVVYLVVNCIPNSNFAALYEGIGDALDKAFHLTEPIYAEQVRKQSSLGKKMEIIKQYIEKFGIGIIIFDEIQLLDFNKTKENSFESLMILSNKTKVAIAVVGTEDARDKMFSELRTARRIGTMINGNMYCEHKDFFDFLVKQLFQYQWFDTPVVLDDTLIAALYDTTKGIVDQLIGIYSCMHYEYLTRKQKPIINADYVYKVAKKYYPGLQDILADMESLSNTAKIKTIRDNANKTIQDTVDKMQQEEAGQAILENQQTITQNQLQLRNIATIIRVMYDNFTDAQIETAYGKIISRKSSANKSEKELCRDIVEYIQKQPKRKVSDAKLIAPNLMAMPDIVGDVGV